MAVQAVERGEGKKRKLKRVTKRASVLDGEQLRMLWDELLYPHDAISQLAFFTASRAGEILAMHWEDVDFDGERVQVYQSKVNAYKTMPMDEHMKAVLLNVRKRSSSDVFLFPTHGERGYMGMPSFHKALKAAAELCGLRGVQTHSFRRSMATLLYKQGVPLLTICKVTGHSSPKNLLLYIDIDSAEANEGRLAILDQLFGRGRNG